MALPIVFATLAGGNEPTSLLDTQFAAVAAMGSTFCTASGANTISLTPTVNQPNVTAYVAGNLFSFAAAGTNTGAATANVSGVGAVAIQIGTAALTGGEIRQGTGVLLLFDGSVFQLIVGAKGTASLLNIQYISATGNYTPTNGTRAITWFETGGGGAGGGCATTGAGQISGGSGGTAGEVRCGFSGSFASFNGAAITIGAGGTGVAGSNGGAGGNTVFLGVTAAGGPGGIAGGAATTPVSNVLINPGGTAAGSGGLLSTGTVQGLPGFYQGTTVLGGWGGSNMFGAGGSWSSGGAGGNAQAPGNGAGGGGSSNPANNTQRAGGNGGAGAIQIFEFA